MHCCAYVNGLLVIKSRQSCCLCKQEALHVCTSQTLCSLVLQAVDDLAWFVQGHQYRNVCDLRKGAATSLITVDFASHTVQDSYSNHRVPSGLPYYSLKAKLSELDFIFLNRFIQEILQYFTVMLALRPPPIAQQRQQSGVPALATSSGKEEVQAEAKSSAKAAQTQQVHSKSAAVPEGSKEVRAVFQLDIEMEAPVISMPRSSGSQDSLQIDLGFLSLHNSLKWIAGSSTDDPQVYVCLTASKIVAMSFTADSVSWLYEARHTLPNRQLHVDRLAIQ